LISSARAVCGSHTFGDGAVLASVTLSSTLKPVANCPFLAWLSFAAMSVPNGQSKKTFRGECNEQSGAWSPSSSVCDLLAILHIQIERSGSLSLDDPRELCSQLTPSTLFSPFRPQ
jgi:hypothetical protein